MNFWQKSQKRGESAWRSTWQISFRRKNQKLRGKNLLEVKLLHVQVGISFHMRIAASGVKPENNEFSSEIIKMRLEKVLC